MNYENIYRRQKVFISVVVILFITVIIKIFYSEFIGYKKINKLANELWNRELPITADRGLILDRNGKVLAGNITTTSLVIIPKQVKDKEDVALKLSKILNVSYDEMYKHVSKKTSIERVHPEGRGLSYTIADEINNLNLDGVYLLKESKRYYPYKNVLSHVLGYVGIDNQGLSGIESYYDNYLKGTDGSIKYISDGKGYKLNKSESYEKPYNGFNVSLTIDLDLQLAIENELDIAISKYNPENALIVAMDPSNGEILAMASRPSFDSNNYKNYDVETINRNLPIWKTYEPGSTFKIITYASAIEENVIDIFNDTFYDTGKVKVAGATLHCWKHEGHGLQTYLEVLQNSCNPGFVSIGQKLGKDTLMKYINDFGFGQKTGIDLNGEENGIMFKKEKMGEVELATTAFGQGISVTPIQQVKAVSAVINGGNLYTPYIVKGILDPSINEMVYKNDKKLEKKVISDKTSELTRYALETVVAYGTGHNAYLENYRVGGKTGTAQKVNNGIYMQGNYILSFIGFMPADNPKIVVYVAIDHPKNTIQYGGTVAAPIAKNVFKSAAKILNIKKSKDSLPKEYSWLDEKYYIVPDAVGKTIKEAKSLLKDFEIKYVGTGDTIIKQSPKPNTMSKEKGTVVLYLN
ncbi:MAG: stage V sporulation protein D [Bacilli bacterium]|nr:stage V sporulation protein D [Bacilli bacterium]